MTAELLNVDALRRKAGLGMGQYVRVRDNKVVPSSVVVEYLEVDKVPVERGFDATEEEWVTGIIDWLREVAHV